MPADNLVTVSWSDIIYMALIFFSLSFMFNAAMRKVLSVKRRKIFSNQYINDQHEKGEKVVRVLSVVLVVAATIFYTNPFMPCMQEHYPG